MLAEPRTAALGALARRLNHPALPCLLVAALYGLFLMRALSRVDAAFFVQAGEHFTDVSAAPPNLTTVTPFTGYDGQFYYRLAVSPFSREEWAAGIRLDNPRYRHQRILYPLLAYSLSFGSPPLVIYSLILVNFLALAVIGWLGGLYAQAAGRHALWGAAFGLYAGYLLTLLRDLGEITEALFLLAGLVAMQRRRWLAAGGLLALAVLAKETALLAAMAVAAGWAWSRWRRAPGALPLLGIITALIPITAYGLWQAWLVYWWGASFQRAFENNLGWPLAGMLDGFERTASIFPGAQSMWLVEVAALAAFGLLVGALLWRSQASLAEKLGWAMSAGLLLILSGNVWIEDWAFLRAASLVTIFGTAVLLNSSGWLARGTLALGAASWAALAVHVLFWRM